MKTFVGVAASGLLIGLLGVSRADDADRAADRAEQKAEQAEHDARKAEHKAEHKADKTTRDTRDEHAATVHHGRSEPRHTTAGVEVTDTWVTTKVKSTFATDRALKGSDISVDTDQNGVVTLTGTVPSASARAHAAEVARGIKGVRKVDDRLTVKR